MHHSLRIFAAFILAVLVFVPAGSQLASAVPLPGLVARQAVPGLGSASGSRYAALRLPASSSDVFEPTSPRLGVLPAMPPAVGNGSAEAVAGTGMGTDKDEDQLGRRTQRAVALEEILGGGIGEASGGDGRGGTTIRLEQDVPANVSGVSADEPAAEEASSALSPSAANSARSSTTSPPSKVPLSIESSFQPSFSLLSITSTPRPASYSPTSAHNSITSAPPLNASTAPSSPPPWPSATSTSPPATSIAVPAPGYPSSTPSPFSRLLTPGSPLFPLGIGLCVVATVAACLVLLAVIRCVVGRAPERHEDMFTVGVAPPPRRRSKLRVVRQFEEVGEGQGQGWSDVGMLEYAARPMAKGTEEWSDGEWDRSSWGSSNSSNAGKPSRSDTWYNTCIPLPHASATVPTPPRAHPAYPLSLAQVLPPLPPAGGQGHLASTGQWWLPLLPYHEHLRWRLPPKLDPHATCPPLCSCLCRPLLPVHSSTLPRGVRGQGPRQGLCGLEVWWEGRRGAL